MDVFVTGGTGFIGSQVVARLLARGHAVRGLARSSRSGERLQAQGAIAVPGDLHDRKALREGMSGCQSVLHVAAAYEFWGPSRAAFRRTNVEGTRIVIECASDAGVSRVVSVSSVVVFGLPTQSPITEDTPVGPVRFSEYARTKYEGDLLAWRLCDARKLPLVVVYPGAVLGPGDPKATGRYVRDFVERRMPATVLQDCTFPFVHVGDVAEAIIRAAETPGIEGRKYLVAAENLTFRQINAMITDISGVRPPRLRLSDPMVAAGAAALTALSTLTRRPPPWGLSRDQIATMLHGPIADGSRTTRELGIAYTPIRRALEEVIAAVRR
jgi:dihydroflavonol-4-reductase